MGHVKILVFNTLLCPSLANLLCCTNVFGSKKSASKSAMLAITRATLDGEWACSTQ